MKRDGLGFSRIKLMSAGPSWGGQATQLGSDLPASYFAEAEQAFAQALFITAEENEYFFSVGGVRFRLRIIGNNLARTITRTLSHLQIESCPQPDFTICAWDDKVAGAPMPRPKRWMLGHAGKHCLQSLTDARFHSFFVEPVRILSCLDHETRTGYSCYFDASHLSMYEVSGPMRPIFNAVLNRHGKQLVHASSVGSVNGTLLFAGRPFSGKSTLAVRCLLDGMSYQADDLCVLSADEKPRTLSLYNIAKLREDRVPYFPALAPVLSSFVEDAEKKSYFYVHEQFPERLLKDAPLQAIVLPHIIDEELSRLEPATGRDAMEGLLKWTVLEVPSATGFGEQMMLRAIKRVPIWHLHLGRDEAHSLKLIRELLAS
jgi:hypothetical protein